MYYMYYPVQDGEGEKSGGAKTGCNTSYSDADDAPSVPDQLYGVISLWVSKEGSQISILSKVKGRSWGRSRRVAGVVAHVRRWRRWAKMALFSPNEDHLEILLLFLVDELTILCRVVAMAGLCTLEAPDETRQIEDGCPMQAYNHPRTIVLVCWDVASSWALGPPWH